MKTVLSWLLLPVYLAAGVVVAVAWLVKYPLAFLSWALIVHDRTNRE